MRKGFTLIELLVVISVIGILATIVLISFTGVQKQARDTARKSDLKQYQSSLEGYASKNNGTYIIKTSATDPNTMCNTLTGSSTGCPVDPKAPTLNYSYCSSTSGIYYALWASLENQTSTYWTVCSTGKIGTSTSAPGCGSSFSCLP
jgi:prepilin-type N-terminal cleavage/methylation domain-containing protein